MNIKSIEVVAAILRSNKNKILVGSRKKNDSNSGRWEFPGGKVNEGETPEEALRRELQEELGIHISSFLFFDEVVHQYASYTVHIRFYISDVEDGVVLTTNSHDELAWIDPKDYNKYHFLEANIGILKKLLGEC